MNFVKDLIGGIAIMIVATLIGVAQNSVRSRPITLFPRVPSTTRDVTKTTPPPSTDASGRMSTGVTPDVTSAGDPVPLEASDEVTADEFAAGELPKERVRAIMEAGTAFIIDARSSHDYAGGHIPGALNVPYENFIDYYADLLDRVPMDATVVTYCRSLTCDLSDNLAQELRIAGYERVLLYRGGWDEWTEAGFPVELVAPGDGE